MKTEKKYMIEFEPDAFDRHNDATRISSKIKNYSKDIHSMNILADELDRFDDFDSLRIPVDQYEHKNGIYGIVRTAEHRSGVIYAHQAQAALAFIRDLRGFGILADVVGSGKTYEAGVVISELAVRNKIRSILFVVPSQALSDWVTVIEQRFGMGVGSLYQAGERLDRSQIQIETYGNYRVPRRPIIVTDDDFVKWGEDCTDLLFDVIVVDEAHHLCAEEGKYSYAMKILSKLVALKRKAKRSYCLLLSATPHSGNLEKMFRLWYFVRCTGGNPSDFDEKEDRFRTAYYIKEKEYYRNYVCKGASTVMEFIETVKNEEVLNSVNKDRFDQYLSENDQLLEFYDLPRGKKNEIISGFLYENDDICDQVYKNVARAYHNRVLRSIMIRQPNANLIAKKKNVVNLLFYRTPNPYKHEIMISDENRKLLLNIDQYNTESAICYDGEQFSVDSYIRDFAGNRRYQDVASELFRKTIVSIDNIDEANANPLFWKKGSLHYYAVQMKNSPIEVKNRLYVMDSRNDDSFEHKFAALEGLLERHRDQRMIVFFDYDLKRKERVVEKFVERIRQSKFCDRFLEGCVQKKTEVERVFNEKEDALLVVTEPSFTESVNLQTSNIIVNFQVIADPVAMDQRIGRIFRLGQKNDVIIYNLADMDRLEGYSLMYLSRIGLLTSNSGDATILAGSNSEKMIAIRCNRCGKVELISESDYEAREKKQQLFCNTPDCMQRGEVLGKISVTDFKCDKCGTSMIRSDEVEGYECVSTPGFGNSKGILQNNAQQFDRNYHCRKQCTMLNCSKLREQKCRVVEALKYNFNASTSELMVICAKCPDKNFCDRKCKPETGINGCLDCGYATCDPKPHKLTFNENWEAKCPVCGRTERGIMRPIVASSFASYIKSSWDFNQDKGVSFCPNLLKEAEKVAEIKKILDMDNLSEDD